MKIKKLAYVSLWMVLYLFLQGCASVPMAPTQEDEMRKQFSPPSKGSSGLYIYRNSFSGAALKKSLFVDGQPVGETANKVYFYLEVPPGHHIVATESEFGENDLGMSTEPGKLYFIEQYIKMGSFVGGAGLKLVDEKEGREMVRKCKLARGIDPSTSITRMQDEQGSTTASSNGKPASRTTRQPPDRESDDGALSKSVACDPRHRHLFFDCE